MDINNDQEIISVLRSGKVLLSSKGTTIKKIAYLDAEITRKSGKRIDLSLESVPLWVRGEKAKKWLVY